MNGARRRIGLWIAILILGIANPVSLPAQVLLVDEFDGTHGGANATFHPGGVVDVSSYRVPFGVGGDDFVGRTNFRFTLPQDGVTTAASGSTDGKVAVLNLDTYNPAAPGATFLGTDFLTKRNFAVGGGLRMTTRMRVDNGTPGGLVAAPFLYDVQRNSPPGTPVRDEIDHEIITNFAQTAGPDNTLTNVWDDGNFSSGGSPVVISNPPGFDVTQFHDYRTDWTPSSVKYYIDGTLVRTETTVVPDDPMRAHVNFWAPDSTFAAAYNAGLTPSSTSPGVTYRAEVDRMQIERLNTTVSGNLLADPGFEGSSGDGNGEWLAFNHAFLVPGEVPLQTEFENNNQALKTYGHFNGQGNASGASQNVAAAPGQEFEGSVWAYARSFDSISGNPNFTNITLQFLNAAGQVLDSVNFSPGRNQKDTPIYDGRDPNMIEDEWVQYTVNAVAPADTAFVRENLFFNQGVPNLPGAVWFDNASLVRLTPNVVGLPGDYNSDSVVDSGDYVYWRKSIGQSSIPNRGDGIMGLVGDADYNFWVTQFGNSASGSGGGSAVPEPASWMLMALASLLAAGGKRRR
jgi:hypothetical protein